MRRAVVLLCARRKRPRYGRATEKSDEVAPLHVAPRLDSEPSTSRLGGELKWQKRMSALGADMCSALGDVRFVPEADI